MRNIIRIILSDWKRLSTNVVAVVVIIGLSVIPCLYAWFNILSNWAPYDEAATSQLSVAVASEDDGIIIGTKELNIGSTILENLEANNSINWIFCDSSYDAVRGVENGDYYAALVIDSRFSENIVSFLGGDMEHPTIRYYENEKINAIAPKITGKVKTTIQRTVNSTFISTIAETVIEAGKFFLNADEENDISGGALSRLRQMDSDMNMAIAMLDSYIALMDSTKSTMEAAVSITAQADTMMENAQGVAIGAQAAANAAGVSVGALTNVLSADIAGAKQKLQSLDITVRSAIASIQQSGSVEISKVTGMQESVTAIQSGFNNALEKIELTGADDHINAVNDSLNKLSTDVSELQNTSNITIDQANALLSRLDTDINNALTSLQNLADVYNASVSPQISGSVSNVENSLSEVMLLLNYTGGDITKIVSVLGSYPDLLSLGRERLVSGRAEIVKMQEKLNNLIEVMEGLDENEQYAMVVKLLKTDPELIADFVSEPIGIDQESIYPIENNGSATAPFYIVLSIWVGALIMVAIIHAKVKPIEGVNNMRTYEEFFGRYATFFVIGQIQTLITVLGALFYVGIQCEHKFLLWLAAAVTSLSFTILLYALAYAFEAGGEAIAVVLMVIQVAGSGGTFPIEVLPRPFQVLYEYMPFMHAMNALRECIAGRYENDYWMYLSGLLVYIGVAIIIGILFSIPAKGLLKKIDESKEKTQLMV